MASRNKTNVDDAAKAAQTALASAGTTVGAQVASGSVASALGLGASASGGGGAAAGAITAASTGLQTALAGAGISVSVPVAGVIIAGSLLAIAGIVAIVRAGRKGSRKRLEAVAAQQGGEGVRFGRAYLAASKRDVRKNTKRLNSLNSSLRALRDKPATKVRVNKAARIVEEMNAVSMVLGAQIQPSEQETPQVADEPSTRPRIQWERTDQENTLMLVFVGGGAAYLAYLVAAGKA